MCLKMIEPSDHYELLDTDRNNVMNIQVKTISLLFRKQFSIGLDKKKITYRLKR